MQKHLKNADNVPVIVAGDFNCVSHLDYSVVTRQSNLNQRRVLPIKASKSMHAAGFNDTYRYANPDINESTLGYTWTTVGMGFVYKDGEGFVPVEKNPEPQFRDPYARIDRIYATGSNIGIIQSKVITHHHDHAHRSFPEFPSDHAAVMTEFAIPKERKN